MAKTFVNNVINYFFPTIQNEQKYEAPLLIIQTRRKKYIVSGKTLISTNYIQTIFEYYGTKKGNAYIINMAETCEQVKEMLKESINIHYICMEKI